MNTEKFVFIGSLIGILLIVPSAGTLSVFHNRKHSSRTNVGTSSPNGRRTETPAIRAKPRSGNQNGAKVDCVCICANICRESPTDAVAERLAQRSTKSSDVTITTTTEIINGKTVWVMTPSTDVVECPEDECSCGCNECGIVAASAGNNNGALAAAAAAAAALPEDPCDPLCDVCPSTKCTTGEAIYVGVSANDRAYGCVGIERWCNGGAGIACADGSDEAVGCVPIPLP